MEAASCSKQLAQPPRINRTEKDMRRQLQRFMATCIAIYRHLTKRHTIVAGAVSITALGCLQEEVISNMLPEDVDFDEDGVAETIDCDDSDPSVGPPPEGRTCEDVVENCQPCEPGCESEIISCNPIPDGDFDGYDASEDCDDSNPDIYPDSSHEPASEAADRLREKACRSGEGIDSDCDGEPDYFCVIVNPGPIEDTDADMDGYFADDDCDDTNPLIHPDARYQPDSESARALEDAACSRGEAIDADCDNEPDYFCVIVNPPPPELEDGDDDGYPMDVDCNDSEELIHPDASYAPGSNEAQYLENLACQTGLPVDADCDQDPDYECGIIINPPPPGSSDMDMDGFDADVDCDDTSSLIFPGAEVQPGSRDAFALEELACSRGEPIDVDCDGEFDFDCMISINPLPDGEERE